jgi:cell division protein ZipA
MEQLSIRDWMILIGGIMIAAVLIDAVRRYWRERRAEIKLNTRIERASPLSGDDDAFNLLTELPNGGARIVHRDDLQVDPQATAPISEASAAGRDGADSTSRHEPAPDPIDVAVAAQLAETSDSGSTEGASAKTESASDDPALSEHDAVESAVGAVTSKPADDVPAPPCKRRNIRGSRIGRAGRGSRNRCRVPGEGAGRVGFAQTNREACA